MSRRFYRARSAEGLGQALQDVRRGRGYSQEDLAQAIGSSRPTLSRLERGNPATTDTVLAALAACRRACGT